MDMSAYKDEIRLMLTGSVLDLELDDPTLERIINSSLREVQRYIETTKLATIPYSGCIDLSEKPVNAVVNVYRVSAGDAQTIQASSGVDPLYASQWQILGGVGTGSNISNWVYNYAAWNTMQQIRNTTSTDLSFKYDRDTGRLYINTAYTAPDYITIEYIPRYDDVSQIVSDYWIDIITKLSIAKAKQVVGRIRSRYTQANPLWEQDGATLLEEGNTELAELREHLVNNTQLVYPID